MVPFNWFHWRINGVSQISGVFWYRRLDRSYCQPEHHAEKKGEHRLALKSHITLIEGFFPGLEKGSPYIQKQRLLYGFVWFCSRHLNEVQYLTQSMDKSGAVSNYNPFYVKILLFNTRCSVLNGCCWSIPLILRNWHNFFSSLKYNFSNQN